MAVPALALGVILRSISSKGVQEAIKRFGKDKVKEAQEAAKSPEMRKKAEEAVKKYKEKSAEQMRNAPKELPPGMTVKNNTIMNKGGMAKSKKYAKGGMANCGASVPPAQKSSKGNK